MEYENGGVFLDRFLGATAADLTDGEATWGNILYQWGRNVPIYAGYVDEWGEEEVFNEARKWTIMNPELFFFWDVSKSLTSVAGSLAAPTTFFADQKTYNWTVEDQSLWGETKTNYDPCPAGYRLPSEKSWGNFFSDLKILEDESGATYTYKGKTAWYPAMNNGRMFDTGENIKGFAGFTVWNCSYMIADPMGILDMNPPYSVEELIEMGLIISAPQRAYMQYNNMQDVVNAHFARGQSLFRFRSSLRKGMIFVQNIIPTIRPCRNGRGELFSVAASTIDIERLLMLRPQQVEDDFHRRERRDGDVDENGVPACHRAVPQPPAAPAPAARGRHRISTR